MFQVALYCIDRYQIDRDTYIMHILEASLFIYARFEYWFADSAMQPGVLAIQRCSLKP